MLLQVGDITQLPNTDRPPRPPFRHDTRLGLRGTGRDFWTETKSTNALGLETQTSNDVTWMRRRTGPSLAHEFASSRQRFSCSRLECQSAPKYPIPQIPLQQPAGHQFHPLGSTMLRHVFVPFNVLVVFYLSLSAFVSAADEKPMAPGAAKRRGYSQGELIPVSCLNRTM